MFFDLNEEAFEYEKNIFIAMIFSPGEHIL